jgi:hypothetical protein
MLHFLLVLFTGLGAALLGIIFTYILFRAASLGWYKSKADYMRRLLDNLEKEGQNGTP